MKYDAQVIDRTTGVESTITLEAPTEGHAFQKAVEAGWIVGKVRQAKEASRREHRRLRGLDLGSLAFAFRERRWLRGLDLGSFAFALVGMAGVFVLGVYANQDTTSGGMHNIGLIHRREVGMMVGCFMAMTGTVCCVLCRIPAELRRGE